MPTIAESRTNTVALRPLTDNSIPPNIPVPTPVYPAAPSSPLRTPLPPIMVLQPDTQRSWYNSAGPQARISPQTGGALPSIGAAAQSQSQLTALQTTMDQIQNGRIFGKPLQVALTAKGQIQLASQSGVVSSGSRPQSINTPLTSVVSSTSVTFYWDGTNSSVLLNIYRDNGEVTGPFSGNQEITGLTPSTNYLFYPYFNDLTDTVIFVQGTVGTPQYAFTAASYPAAQTMIMSHHIPLESGGFQITTPASGTNPPQPGDGGGGGGGGGNQPLPAA